MVRLTILAVLIVLSHLVGIAQTRELSIGDQAPEIKVQALLQVPAEAKVNSEALRGKVVILDFWATWCSPCVASIPHLNRLVEEFSDQAVVFVSITDDDPKRLASFLKSTPMKSWIGIDTDRANWGLFSVASIPHTVVLDSAGRVRAVTLPEHISSQVIRDVLAGRSVTLPTIESRHSNLDWDQEEIEWKDGIKPVFSVVIKPVKTATAGTWLRPEGNYFTADGVPLERLVQVAYKTDIYHIDWRLPKSEQGYRVVLSVPPAANEELLPLLQRALTAAFSFETRWVSQEKDVYVLQLLDRERSFLTQSVQEQSSYEMFRGRVKAIRQPIAMLSEFLTSALRLPVVDETGLSGTYEWDLPYQPGQPEVTLKAMRARLGLQLVKARRSIGILIVEPKER